MDVEVTVGTSQQPPALPPGDRFQGHLLRQLVEGAKRTAEQSNQPEVNNAHLLCALIETADAPTRTMAENCGLNLESLRTELQRSTPDDLVLIDRPIIGSEACATFNQAVHQAQEDGVAEAGTRHILLAILGSVAVTDMLQRLSVAVERLKHEARARPVPLRKRIEQEG